MIIRRTMEAEWIYREFGDRLRNQRKNSKLTQDGLAERVGLSRTSITNIEKGRQHITLHMLYILSDVLGVSPVDLLPPKGIVAKSHAIDKELENAPLGKEGKEWVKRIVALGEEAKNESH